MLDRSRSLRALRPLGSWRRADLLAYQDRCVAAVVRHAAARVPHYRRLFAEAGLDADTVRSVADLARVPLSTRRALQALPPRDIVSEGIDPGRILNHMSSGSTGEPFTTRRTRFEDRVLLTFRLRILLALGMRPLEPWLGFWWLGRGEGGGRDVARRWEPWRRRAVSCKAPLDLQLAELRKGGFSLIGGLPITLVEIAGAMTAEDRARARPRFVMTAGESSSPEQRRRIAEAFSAPVYDLYGTNEFNIAAWQCPETGLYHVSDPTVVIEVLDERGRPVPEGGEGEVYGTNLHAYAMPYIRYRLDDLAVRGPATCPCGAPFSTLVRILGRVTERFRMPDGTARHPYLFQETFLGASPWIGGFQIIQERIDRVRVRLRPLPGVLPTAADLARVEAGIRSLLGESAEVVPEVVDSLPRGGRGKALHYVCMVDREAAARGDASRAGEPEARSE